MGHPHQQPETMVVSKRVANKQGNDRQPSHHFQAALNHPRQPETLANRMPTRSSDGSPTFCRRATHALNRNAPFRFQAAFNALENAQ
ncbi:hypothetical protein [Kingella oralis]|uniref:hypothetical protein n=1 Tax=Kingella oralis TaxID=505 RepID=UPI0034E56415